MSRAKKMRKEIRPDINTPQWFAAVDGTAHAGALKDAKPSIDISGADKSVVEVMFCRDRVWINVDGVCMFRAQRCIVKACKIE